MDTKKTTREATVRECQASDDAAELDGGVGAFRDDDGETYSVEPDFYAYGIGGAL